jgi:outer membrane protein OmpA-like peptidoglycan-associated protein
MRRTVGTLSAIAASLGLLALAPEARAQDALPADTGFDLRLFRHAIDSKGQFSVNGTDTLGHLHTSFGLVVDWGRGLARQGTLLRGMQTETQVPLVENLVTGTFSANLGLFNRLVVGLQLPVHLVGGPGPGGTDGTLQPIAGYTPQNGGLDYQGFGSITLHAKLRLLPPTITTWGLALIMQAGIPLSSGPSNFAGDPGVMLWPSIAAEWHPVSRFRMDLNLGYRLGLGTGARLVDTTYGSPVTAGLGMSVRVGPALDLVAEVYGGTYSNAMFGANTTPFEAVGGLKIFVVDSSYLMLGAGRRITGSDAAADLRAFVGFVFEPSIGDRDGDGFRDDVDRCPDSPEDFDHFEDTDGCPEPDNDQDGIRDGDDQCPLTPEDRDGGADVDGCPDRDNNDRDGDGILDNVDRCPDEPEDRDNFEDTDGCPDPDNDRDGILDRVDLCPNDPEDRDNFEDDNGCPDPDNDHDRIPDVRDRCPNDPETYNAHEDEDGCPDQGVAVLEENTIRILQAINFETDSAQIRPESMPIIEAVAATLRANDQIQLLQVQGHADERGDDNHNLQLTRDRAASVVAALTQRGVGAERLHAAGYGERCPVNAGRGAVAWAANRRVVFLILRTSAGPTRVTIACPAGEDLIPDEDRDLR